MTAVDPIYKNFNPMFQCYAENSQLPEACYRRGWGVATAAGCQLVASCDLAIASNTAQFCTPGVNIGLFCSTPMIAISRNLANKHVMEMLLTGDMVPAGEPRR